MDGRRLGRYGGQCQRRRRGPLRGAVGFVSEPQDAASEQLSIELGLLPPGEEVGHVTADFAPELRRPVAIIHRKKKKLTRTVREFLKLVTG